MFSSMDTLLSYFLVFSLATLTRTQAKEWTTEDQLQVVTFSDAQISPDGHFVAAVVTDTVPSSSSERKEPQTTGTLGQGGMSFRQRLLVFNALGTRMRVSSNASSVTTFCDTAGDCQLPRWSSGGHRLTFVSSGTKQTDPERVWYSDVDGSAWTEPKRLFPENTSPFSVDFYAWSLDGKSLAYTQAVPQVLNTTVREVTGDVLVDVIGNAAAVAKYELCTVNAVTTNKTPSETADPHTCYHIDKSVGFPAWYISCWPHPSQFSWSKLGLMYTATNNTLANDWTSMGVSVLNVTTGQSTLLGNHMFQPMWSPDHELIVTAKMDMTYWTWSQAWVICVGRSADMNLHCDEKGSPDREPQLIGVTGDGRFVLYTEQQMMQVNLYAAEIVPCGDSVMIGSHHIVPIEGAPTGVISNVAMATSGVKTVLTFVAENAESAPELFSAELTISTVGLPFATANQLSSLNEKSRPTYTFAHSTITWNSKDNTSVQGILLEASSKPLEGNTKANSPQPLVLFIHPGPNLAHTDTFLGFGGVGARYPVATMAERGYAMLMPNIRGSSGYGAAWRASIYQDWGGVDLDDAMYGVKHLIDAGKVDPKRVAVIGWSYGGYMTSMALTKSAERYNITLAAAAVGGGIVDLVSHTGTADISAILQNTFDGFFWQADSKGKELLSLYEDRSAMFSIAQATGVYDSLCVMSLACLYVCIHGGWIDASNCGQNRRLRLVRLSLCA